jgi:hypothetical protein
MMQVILRIGNDLSSDVQNRQLRRPKSAKPSGATITNCNNMRGLNMMVILERNPWLQILRVRY